MKKTSKTSRLSSILEPPIKRKWTNEVVIYRWPLLSKILSRLNQGEGETFVKKLVRLVYYILVKRRKPWL